MDGASCVVAFIGLGLQIHDTIKRIVDFLDQVKNAPNSIQRLRYELETLGSIIDAAIKNDEENLKDVCEETQKAYERALGAVSDQCDALLSLLGTTLPNHTAKWRKRLLHLKHVFREDEIKQHIDNLERAKSSFQSAQLLITK
jgi:hypothetical protein